MWSHRNNVVLRNITSYHVSIIEHAMKTYYMTLLYNSKTNMVLQDINTGNVRYKRNNRTVKQRWIPPPIGLSGLLMHVE